MPIDGLIRIFECMSSGAELRKLPTKENTMNPGQAGGTTQGAIASEYRYSFDWRLKPEFALKGQAMV